MMDKSERVRNDIERAFDVVDTAIERAGFTKRILEGTRPNSERVDLAERSFQQLGFAQEEILAVEETFPDIRDTMTRLRQSIQRGKDWFAGYLDMNA